MEQEPTRTAKKIDTGLLVGILAIVINIITVSVYVHQANIMSKQLHAAVWPHLECLPSYNNSGFYLEIENTGIGPAKIKNVNIKVKGRTVPSLDSVFIYAIGTNKFPHVTSSVLNRVVAPGQKIRPFEVNDREIAQKLYDGLNSIDFEYQICFESIYGDAWTVLGVEVTESKCDQ